MSNIPGLPINLFMLVASLAIVVVALGCPAWNRWRRRGMSTRSARRIRLGILSARHHMDGGVYVYPQSDLGRRAYGVTVWRRLVSMGAPVGQDGGE